MSRRWVLLALLTVCLVFTAAVAHGDDDNTLPGIPRPLPIDMTDSLTAPADVDDVSTVYLPGGRTFFAYLETDETQRFRMAIFPPDATGVSDLNEAVAISASPLGLTGGPQLLLFTPKTGGFYYLDTYMAVESADGAYGLTARTLPKYSVSRPTVPSRIKRGKWFTATSYLSEAWDIPGATASFKLQKYTSGKWKTKWATMNAFTKIEWDKNRSKLWVKILLRSGKYRIRATFKDGWGKTTNGAYKEFRVQ